MCAVRSARYSVPNRLIGTSVMLSVTQNTVRVLAPFTGEVLAEHPLVAAGETSICDEHYGSTRPDRPRRAPRAKTATEKAFLALGPVAEAFITGAAAAGVSQLGTELDDILTLQTAHGTAGSATAPSTCPSTNPANPAATATKPAESPNIGGFTCDLSTPKGGDF